MYGLPSKMRRIFNKHFATKLSGLVEPFMAELACREAKSANSIESNSVKFSPTSGLPGLSGLSGLSIGLSCMDDDRHVV